MVLAARHQRETGGSSSGGTRRRVRALTRGPLEHAQQDVRVHRLGEGVRRVELARDLWKLDSPGEEHDGYVLEPAVMQDHAIRHGSTVHRRHLDVEQQHVREILRQERAQPFLTVACRTYLVAVVGEKIGQALSYVRIIVHDQELRQGAAQLGTATPGPNFA